MRTQGSFSCRRQTFLSKAYKVCHLHRSMNAFILNMMLFFGSLLFLFRYFLSFWRSLVLSLFGTAIISGLLLFFPVDFPFFITAAGPILVLSHFIHYVMEGKTQLFHHLWQILLHFILGFVA